jgi:RNA polymerase sigma factor (sigma-70 family)
VIFGRDPLADPERLIKRVYAYVAYRIGDGPEAEDVTSDTFERALRYRKTYDSSKGEPVAWLIGIARRCIDDAVRDRLATVAEVADSPTSEELEKEAVERITVAAAVAGLGSQERELVALRYGADLTSRQIAELVGMKTNAVEVALHRARERLRAELGGPSPQGKNLPRGAEAL